MLQIGLAPAPPSVVEAVEEIVVETSLDIASAFRIRLGIAQNDLGDWRLLQQNIFRPLTLVTVRVALGAVPIPMALVNGYVMSAVVKYADEAGSSTLEVFGLDAMMLMDLQEKVVPWPNLPDSAIATAIFAQYRLVPMVQPTAPTLVEPEGTVIQRGTDLRFLRMRALRNGFDIWVQPEPLTGVDQGFFRQREPLGLPDAVLNVNMGSETNVARFSVRHRMTRPTSAVGAGLDTTTKSPQPALAPVSIQPPMGLEPALLSVLPTPVVRPADTGLVRTSELQAFAQGIADKSSYAVEAEGEVGPDVGVLRPGRLVAVRGLGRLYNGIYLLTSVTHRISDEGYSQKFSAVRNATTMTGAEPYVALP